MRFSCFLVLPGSAVSQHIWGGTVKCLLIDYFIDNISAKNIIPSQHDSRANGSITARKRQLDRSSRFDLRLSIRQCDRRKNGQLPVPYSISTAGYGAVERKKHREIFHGARGGRGDRTQPRNDECQRHRPGKAATSGPTSGHHVTVWEPTHTRDWQTGAEDVAWDRILHVS